VSGSERKVLEDFMWLVQRHFPRLQPFSELGACRGSGYLLRLRCKAILDEVGAVPAELRTAGPTTATPAGASLLLEGARAVKLAGLESDDAESAVWLRLFPGDTLEQAKALYADTDRVDQLLSLRDQGWTIAPNFHFGHMAKGFVWTTGDVGVEDYVRYWLEHIGAAGQVRREDWSGYFARLIKLGIASEADREDFDRNFAKTKRSSNAVGLTFYCRTDKCGKLLPENDFRIICVSTLGKAVGVEQNLLSRRRRRSYLFGQPASKGSRSSSVPSAQIDSVRARPMIRMTRSLITILSSRCRGRRKQENIIRRRGGWRRENNELRLPGQRRRQPASWRQYYRLRRWLFGP
jgi:hypothetical protein